MEAKTKKIIIGGLAAIAVIGIGIWAYNKYGKPSETKTGTSNAGGKFHCNCGAMVDGPAQCSKACGEMIRTK